MKCLQKGFTIEVLTCIYICTYHNSYSSFDHKTWQILVLSMYSYTFVEQMISDSDSDSSVTGFLYGS